ncbi:MAG: radical SAM protein, partial [Aigarchaeota archaeon]|nr:radical SAM protein [Aigarchaeota archaeon]
MAVTIEEVRQELKRKVVTTTRSVCPECNRILPAEVFEEDNRIYIRKVCPVHGEFDELYFGDAKMY